MLDQAAPVLFAAAEIAVALVIALPALFMRSLRRPLWLAVITAAVVFGLVFGVVVASDLTSPAGQQPFGTTLYVGILSGVIWATFLFIIAFIPLALLALIRARRG